MINTRIVKLVAQRILHRCLLFRLVLASDGTKSGGRRTLRLFQRLPSVKAHLQSRVGGIFPPSFNAFTRIERIYHIRRRNFLREMEIFQTFWTMKVSKYTYRRTLLLRYLERIGQEVSGIYNFVVQEGIIFWIFARRK